MSKINKIGKSSFVIAILSFVLVAVLAFGGTYAYFTAQTNTVSGSAVTGHLNIGSVAATNAGIKETDKLAMDGGIVVPNQTIVNSVFSAEVTSNIKFFARVKFSVKIDIKGDDVYPEGHEKAGQPTEESANYQHTHEGTCADITENAIEALIIKLNGDAVTAGKMSDAASQSKTAADAFTSSNVTWVKGTPEGTVATETTAYFYNLAPYAVTPGADNATVKTTVYFPAYIQVQEFLGRAEADTAERCPYWMDATISMTMSVEVIQADCLDATKAPVTGTDGAFKDMAEAKTAWEYALGVTNGAA